LRKTLTLHNIIY